MFQDTEILNILIWSLHVVYWGSEIAVKIIVNKYFEKEERHPTVNFFSAYHLTKATIPPLEGGCAPPTFQLLGCGWG